MIAKTVENQSLNTESRARVNARIGYPSYRSFGNFSDVESLRSLNAYIARQITRHIETAQVNRRTRTEELEYFVLLTESTDTFRFQSTGQILIICDDSATPVPAHRDHQITEISSLNLMRQRRRRFGQVLTLILSAMNEETLAVLDAAKSDAAETFEFSAVDPRVSYPSYRSFDEFIDVDRLRSLDGYVRQRVKRHLLEREERKFYTGPYRLNGHASDLPGSRMIYLASTDLPDSYFDLDRTDVWKPGEAANDFPRLMDFIAELPFEATGRMLIMFDDEPREVPAHRDHIETDVLHEFIWFRTNLSKPLYMLNHHSGKKLHVSSYSAWFDTVNQFHGSDPAAGLTFSVRVDGRFTDEFRAQIPRPPINAASTPSYWAGITEPGVG